MLVRTTFLSVAILSLIASDGRAQGFLGGFLRLGAARAGAGAFARSGFARAGGLARSSFARAGGFARAGATRAGTLARSGATRAGTLARSGATRVGTLARSGAGRAGTLARSGAGRVSSAARSGLSRLRAARPQLGRVRMTSLRRSATTLKRPLGRAYGKARGSLGSARSKVSSWASRVRQSPGRNVNPALRARLRTYKGWKSGAGIQGKPTMRQFRAFSRRGAGKRHYVRSYFRKRTRSPRNMTLTRRGEYTAASRRRLRGGFGRRVQDHHIIPRQHRGHTVMRHLNRRGTKFHINSRNNRVLLPSARNGLRGTVHRGNHAKYNVMTRRRLDSIQRLPKNQWGPAVRRMQLDMRHSLRRGTGRLSVLPVRR